MNKDLAAGMTLLALAGGYALLTRGLSESSLSDGVGPAGLPILLAIGLAVVSTAIIIKSLLVARPQPETPVASNDNDEEEPPASLMRALCFAAIGIGYMLLAPWLGFALGIALLFIAVAWFEGGKPSLKLVLVSAAIGGGFWLVFVMVLGVEQPAFRLLEWLK